MRLPVLKLPSKQISHLPACWPSPPGGRLWYPLKLEAWLPVSTPLQHWLFLSHPEPFTLQALREPSRTSHSTTPPSSPFPRQPDLVLWILQALRTPVLHPSTPAVLPSPKGSAAEDPAVPCRAKAQGCLTVHSCPPPSPPHTYYSASRTTLGDCLACFFSPEASSTSFSLLSLAINHTGHQETVSTLQSPHQRLPTGQMSSHHQTSNDAWRHCCLSVNWRGQCY